MSLDALAPDQRAVVQLVLQQERSYEELAGLLGISTDAVRERAHNGLERLAPASGVPADQRAQIADYLLAQQSVSKREATRSLLSSSLEARAWAHAVSDQLRDVASAPLPDIPAGKAAAAPAPAFEPEPEPELEPEPEPEPEAAPEPEPEPAEPTAETPAVRARPRPRPAAEERPPREREKPSTTPPARPPVRETPPKSSSKLGGALLIGGLALALAAVIAFLVSGDDDPKKTTTTTGAKASPTASATSSFQPVGQIELSQVGTGKAKGQMVIFASPDNALAFTIQATDMPASKRGEAYAVWLIGGDAPHRMGFAPPVGEDGKFGTSGPRTGDAKKFPNWLAEAKQVIVSRETDQDAEQPGPIVLAGDIPSGQG